MFGRLKIIRKCFQCLLAGDSLQYEIEDEHTITSLAVRHQREDDYH